MLWLKRAKACEDHLRAPVAELVDATDSKSVVLTGVPVRVRPGAPPLKAKAPLPPKFDHFQSPHGPEQRLLEDTHN